MFEKLNEILSGFAKNPNTEMQEACVEQINVYCDMLVGFLCEQVMEANKSGGNCRDIDSASGLSLSGLICLVEEYREEAVSFVRRAGGEDLTAPHFDDLSFDRQAFKRYVQQAINWQLESCTDCESRLALIDRASTGVLRDYCDGFLVWDAGHPDNPDFSDLW